MTLLLVALGAAAGAPVRYVTAHLLDRRRRDPRHDGLPWGTIAVNLVGSFVLGVLSGLAVGDQAMALVGVGFCGAMTTFSAFAVQAHDLGSRKGAATVALTVVPAVALCFAGFWLAA